MPNFMVAPGGRAVVCQLYVLGSQCAGGDVIVQLSKQGNEWHSWTMEVSAHDMLARARRMLDLAESVDAGHPGAFEMTYQAADRSCKVLLRHARGADIWSHSARERRLSELLRVDADDLRFLHEVRQIDFYADTGFAPDTGEKPFLAPTADQVVRALEIARRVVREVAARLQPSLES